MIVWRVETEGGKGPYNHFICGTHHDPHPLSVGWAEAFEGGRRPDPHEDPLLEQWEWKLTGEPVFGFCTHDQLCAWWDTADLTVIAAACSEAMFVARWRLKKANALPGEKQVVFLRDGAQRLSRWPLCDFVANERKVK